MIIFTNEHNEHVISGTSRQNGTVGKYGQRRSGWTGFNQKNIWTGKTDNICQQISFSLWLLKYIYRWTRPIEMACINIYYQDWVVKLVRVYLDELVDSSSWHGVRVDFSTSWLGTSWPDTSWWLIRVSMWTSWHVVRVDWHSV